MLIALAAHAADPGLFERVVTAAFDPQWNLEHRGVTWAGILTVLFFSGVGLPMPEDLPLTLAGFTTFKQCHDTILITHYIRSFVMAATAILSGDMVAYTMGRRYGLGIRDRFRVLRRVFTNARVGKVRRWFEQYGSFAVFLGRQVAGVRFVTFFLAGTMRVPRWKFVLFDFLGCLVSVPVWFAIGTLAARYGLVWMRAISSRIGGGFALAALIAFLLLFLVAKLRHARAPADSLIPPADEPQDDEH